MVSEKIALDLISSPEFRVREKEPMEGIEELAESIRAIDLINPIQVKKVDEHFEVIAGERRFLAHKFLGLKEIKCDVVNKTDEEHEEIKLAENISRIDLNPIEMGIALLRLENGYKITSKQIARKLGKTERWVELKISLLKLPIDLIDALRSGLIGENVARELAQVDEDLERKRLLTFAVANGATWKVVNDWVTNWRINKGIGEQIINKEVSQAELQGRSTVVVKCMLCGENGDITEVRYEPCHKDCYLELILEIQKRNK